MHNDPCNVQKLSHSSGDDNSCKLCLFRVVAIFLNLRRSRIVMFAEISWVRSRY